jgi:CTP:molybdopterin cytidylyltransferase MocA
MIGGVLLAAGAGSRFRAAGGDIKLLAPFDGRPLVERALAALATAPLGDRVIVLGAHAVELLEAVDLHGARPVRNEHWERGMASSLQVGLAALDPACTAAVVVLGDGPLLAAEAIRRVAAAAEGAELLVAATYDGVRGGHPVAIPRALWKRLPQTGEQGAKALGEPGRLIDCSDLPPPGDADTPADLPGGQER